MERRKEDERWLGFIGWAYSEKKEERAEAEECVSEVSEGVSERRIESDR